MDYVNDDERMKIAQHVVALLGVVVGAALIALLGMWVMSLLLGGCGPACSARETRCSGARAEVCDGDGQWQLVMDCATVSSPECAEWACCAGWADDAGPLHTCLPAQECLSDSERDGGES